MAPPQHRSSFRNRDHCPAKMPRAEGQSRQFLCILLPFILFILSSWNPEIPREQDEVKGSATAPMVLPSLRETVQRRERLQVPCPVGKSSAADARRRRERWQTHPELLAGIPVHVCRPAVPTVRPISALTSARLPDFAFAAGSARNVSGRTRSTRNISATRGTCT